MILACTFPAAVNFRRYPRFFSKITILEKNRFYCTITIFNNPHVINIFPDGIRSYHCQPRGLKRITSITRAELSGAYHYQPRRIGV